MNDLIKKIHNVDFELTYLCNLKCMHCYNPTHEKTSELSTEKVKAVTKEIYDIGFKEIHYNGGEPLLRKDINEILEYSSSLGLVTILETNATKLVYPQSLKFKNLKIRASIDGSEKVHNYIRSRDKSSNNYQTSLRNLANAHNLGIPVEITCSVNSINHTSIYKMVQELIASGLDDVRLRLSMPTGHALGNWEELKMSNDELEVLRKQVELIKRDFPEISFNDKSLVRGIPEFELKFFIEPRGFVKPYPFIEEYIGNVKHESIESILSKIPEIKFPETEKKMMIDYLRSLNMVSDK
ncbi:MAG: radical SAM protein [Candidatus Woesearchaeota archaeon]